LNPLLTKVCKANFSIHLKQQTIVSIQIQRWEILALLVFRALELCVGKTESAKICGWFSMKHNVWRYIFRAAKELETFQPLKTW